jgi:hypothetical protein
MSANEHSRVAEGELLLEETSGAGLALDVLQQAKERQDRVHAALETWIAATIAELAAER